MLFETTESKSAPTTGTKPGCIGVWGKTGRRRRSRNKLSPSSFIPAIFFTGFFALNLYKAQERYAWVDEAATMAAIKRSFSDLYKLISEVDMVHAAYYFTCKLWVKVFGETFFSLRLLSVSATIGGAIFLYLACKAYFSRFYALLPCAIFLLLPRTVFLASNARSEALVMLCAAILFCLFTKMRTAAQYPGQPKNHTLYAGFFLAAVAGILYNLYFILYLLCFALTYLLDKNLRQRLKIYDFAYILGAAFTTGVIWTAVCYTQKGQVDWITQEVHPLTIGRIFEGIFFTASFSKAVFVHGNWLDSLVAGKILFIDVNVLLILSAVFIWIFILTFYIKKFIIYKTKPDSISIFAFLCIVLPAAVLIGGSLVSKSNLYLPRYNTFSVIGMALLLSRPLYAWLRKTLNSRSKPKKYISLIIVFNVLLIFFLAFPLNKESTYEPFPQVLCESIKENEGFLAKGTSYEEWMIAAYPECTRNKIDVTLKNSNPTNFSSTRFLLKDEEVLSRINKLDAVYLTGSLFRETKKEDELLREYGFTPKDKIDGVLKYEKAKPLQQLH